MEGDDSFDDDDDIAQEERLIRLYEAELSLLKGEDKNEATNLVGEGEIPAPVLQDYVGDGDDALDWILHLNDGNGSSGSGDPQETVSDFLKSVERSSLSSFQQHDEAVWWGDKLQPLLRNFCFTSVQHNHHQESSIIDHRHRQTFTFRGYFLANDTVHAVINLVIEQQQLKDEKDSNKQNHRHSSSSANFQIHSITCELESSSSSSSGGNDGNITDWTWLQKQVASVIAAGSKESNNTYFLAAWISGVSEYLAFDTNRTIKLQNHREQTCDCGKTSPYTVQYSQSKTVICIPIIGSTTNDNDDTNNNPTLNVVWAWRWKERCDCLRLMTATTTTQGGSFVGSSAISLRQADFDSLVEAMGGDCWRTLETLIRHCSGCHCWRNDSDDDINSIENENNEALPQQAVLLSATAVSSSLHLKEVNADADDEESNDDDDEPFRYSPVSNRRRSDYEVRRLERIHRNEQKLHELGLLQPISMFKNNIVDDYEEDEAESPGPPKKMPKPLALLAESEISSSKKAPKPAPDMNGFTSEQNSDSQRKQIPTAHLGPNSLGGGGKIRRTDEEKQLSLSKNAAEDYGHTAENSTLMFEATSSRPTAKHDLEPQTSVNIQRQEKSEALAQPPEGLVVTEHPQKRPYSRRKRIPTNHFLPAALAGEEASRTNRQQLDTSSRTETASGEKLPNETSLQPEEQQQEAASVESRDRDGNMTEQTRPYSRRKRIPTSLFTPTAPAGIEVFCTNKKQMDTSSLTAAKRESETQTASGDELPNKTSLRPEPQHREETLVEPHDSEGDMTKQTSPYSRRKRIPTNRFTPMTPEGVEVFFTNKKQLDMSHPTAGKKSL
jgi:hypothetical protein